jgi:hypothetical protein
MNSDDIYNAFDKIDDTFAAQSEAARSGSDPGAGNNAAKQSGNRRSGQRSRVFPVLSLALLLAVGLAVGLLISAKGKKSRSGNTMLNNNTPIPTATLPPATASTTEQPSAAAASPTPVDHPPQDELLKIEVFNGEVRFMRIATTPEAAYYQKGTADIPFNTIPNVSEGAPVSDPYAVLHALFLAVDKKEASASGWYNGNVFDHYVYLYDKDTAIPWHYVFAFDESGEMMVVNNGELIAFVKLSEAEAASILATLPVRETGDRPATEVPATATPEPTLPPATATPEPTLPPATATPEPTLKPEFKSMQESHITPDGITQPSRMYSSDPSMLHRPCGIHGSERVSIVFRVFDAGYEQFEKLDAHQGRAIPQITRDYMDRFIEGKMKFWICDVDGNKIDYVFANKDGFVQFILYPGTYTAMYEDDGVYKTIVSSVITVEEDTCGSPIYDVFYTIYDTDGKVGDLSYIIIYNYERYKPVTVKVTDEETGMPVPDTYVAYQAQHLSEGTEYFKTDENGELKLNSIFDFIIKQKPTSIDSWQTNIRLYFEKDGYAGVTIREDKLKSNFEVKLKKA